MKKPDKLIQFAPQESYIAYSCVFSIETSKTYGYPRSASYSISSFHGLFMTREIVSQLAMASLAAVCWPTRPGKPKLPEYIASINPMPSEPGSQRHKILAHSLWAVLMPGRRPCALRPLYLIFHLHRAFPPVLFFFVKGRLAGRRL
ncbi:hypothetical protein DdX_03105 [Ditylenchus destructor]|uniref:Uncharacterized protein n=1 Tax=Ditylenchus destructor TaxID=166010 RepID=A0AAD4NHC7_9BILA|nr:hypothetical protein DdX_03105 [Ditylenchus destructor]